MYPILTLEPQTTKEYQMSLLFTLRPTIYASVAILRQVLGMTLKDLEYYKVKGTS